MAAVKPDPKIDLLQCARQRIAQDRRRHPEKILMIKVKIYASFRLVSSFIIRDVHLTIIERGRSHFFTRTPQIPPDNKWLDLVSPLMNAFRSRTPKKTPQLLCYGLGCGGLRLSLLSCVPFPWRGLTAEDGDPSTWLKADLLMNLTVSIGDQALVLPERCF